MEVENYLKLSRIWTGVLNFSCSLVPIYIKAETKWDLSFKFGPNRLTRTLSPMRTFVNLASEKMTDSSWLICCSQKRLRAVVERVSQIKKQIVH